MISKPYEAVNQRTSLILPNGISMVYGYDAANELMGINYHSPTNTAMGSLNYGYDLDGHRISKIGSFATDVLPAPTSSPGTFDLNNRQTSFNVTSPSYDANGNLTSNGIDTFVRNARNQLTQINAGSTTQFSYAYDALGRRISKSVAGASAPTTYLYDCMNLLQEAVGSVTNPILTGLGIDERFARNDVNGRTDLLTDALNSTIALTDPTGAITQQYSYDPYGNVTQSNTTTGFTNPYLYTGREADSAGLYYYRARYYSPTMGRFISEDPIGFNGGQNNFYAYAGNNPINYRDPSGKLIPEAFLGAVIGGVVGYVTGEISGDTGDQLTNDILAGAGTGFLAGLTDGASLLENAAADAVAKGAITTAVSTGLEINRQYQNYGCVKSVADVALAGGLGALGGFASGSAIRAYSGAELSLGQSVAVTGNAGVAAGAFQTGFTSLETDQERSESGEGCGCEK